MIKYFIVIFLILTSQSIGYSQSNEHISKQYSVEQRDSIYKQWIDDLYDFGVKRTGDSITLNKDVERILEDSLYRNLIYPESYLMAVVQLLISKRALKPAFWYLINIYADDSSNRDEILNIIIPMDRLIELDKALVATYYTYIAFDPEVYSIVEGKELPREVSRPDIAEKKLLATKEIVEYVLLNRSNRASK